MKIKKVLKMIRAQLAGGVYPKHHHFNRGIQVPAPVQNPFDLPDDKKWADRYDHPKE